MIADMYSFSHLICPLHFIWVRQYLFKKFM